MKLKDVERADSWLKRGLGLMFRGSQKRPMVFVLGRETRVGASIHCFFMRFPIDILFLDSERKVVDRALNVKPWTPRVTPKRPVSYVVELPAGKGASAKIGERVDW